MHTVLASINQPLPAPSAAGAPPEFIQLLPEGVFTGADGRGPYDATNKAAILAATSGKKLPIDIAHAIDHLAGTGAGAPAVGWVTAIEARDGDGIWGRVEWNAKGSDLVAGKEYGFISPVFLHTKSAPMKVTQILRASLTNNPNLTLASLHQKGQDMEKELRTALGLTDDADQAAILAAVTTSATASTAMSKIAEAAGLAKNASADDVVAALAEQGDKPTVAALQQQIKALNTQLATVVTNTAKDRAVVVIDQAIADMKIVPALRDHMISRHVKDPAEVEAEIKLMPSLNTGGLGHRPALETGDGQITGSDAEVCEMMGLDPKAFAATSKALQKETL